MCYLKETHFKYNDTYRFKSDGWRKIYHANPNQKKARRERRNRIGVMNIKHHNIGRG